MDKPIEKIMKLNAVTYENKTEKYVYLDKGKKYGLIAEEVEKVIPEIIKEISDSRWEETETGITPVESDEKIKGINYTALITMLIGAVQEQQKTIEKLEKILLKK